jgi:hypothetical protein
VALHKRISSIELMRAGARCPKLAKMMASRRINIMISGIGIVPGRYLAIDGQSEWATAQ